MFDLTKQIKLPQESLTLYIIAKRILYAIFILGASFVAIKILFPSRQLTLSFENINSTKNTLVSPRLSNGNIPPKGAVNENEKFTINANPLGNFSQATVSFKTNKETNANNATVSIKKSYQSFLYPNGEPVGFPAGSLLESDNGSYYIISNGLLRKFENTNIIENFGFEKNAFVKVSEDDLKYNTSGPNITSSNTYPDDSLFLIEDKFYQLKNLQLMPFISERAFLSQYKKNQAISKDKNFFDFYALSDVSIGFSNGTLASTNESVFILSEGKSYPVADLPTFQAMGFSWDNVIKLESDELGFYERQKQFDLNQPHPNGTLFLDNSSNKFFVIENGKKRPIISENILKFYPSQMAILVNQDDANKNVKCKTEKRALRASTYSCNVPLSEISNNLGNSYQIETNFQNDTNLNQVDVVFSTPLTVQNLRFSLSKIRENLKNNYIQQ